MFAPGCRLQRPLRQQPHEVVAVDELALLVEEEAAVEVAVPGDAQVGARLEHGLRRSPPGSRAAAGSARPCGKVPSGVSLIFTNCKGRCGSSRSMTGPAPPLPGFTTTLSGRSAPASM